MRHALPRKSAGRGPCQRRGVTMIEAAVGLVVLALVAIVAIPLIYRGLLSTRKNACSFNLRKIGQAIDSYQNRHNGQLPSGSRYQGSPASPWGASWWVDILPQAEVEFPWNNKVANSGAFDLAANPNIKLVDGLLPSIMYCAASELPTLNDPQKHISKSNRELIGGVPQGIALPSFVAISGSAPDMRGLSPSQPVSGPHGRNTKDGPLGILSGSGAFPPNQSINLASLRDGQGQVIMIGEQSAFGVEVFYDKPLRHELRSSWTGGGYRGAGAQYGQLSPTAEDINGSGVERCFNVTTIRYGINTTAVDVEKPRHGIIADRLDPYPNKLEKDQKPRKPVAQPAGPGHNQGIFSVHAGGANVLFGDGRVEFLADDLDIPVLQMLATRDDGNIDTHKK